MNGITRGSAFKSGIRIGSVRGLNTPFTNYPTFDNGYPGIPTGVSYPFILPAPNDGTGNLYPTAYIPAAGVLTLTPGAGVVVDTTTFPGYTAYDLGSARTLLIGGGPDNNTTFTISGWDYWGAQVVETVSVATADHTTITNKAMRWIHTIQASASSTVNAITIGASNSFGFPYRIINNSYVLPIFLSAWAYDSPMALSETINLADDTFPATATTGDVRGTYQFTSAEVPNGNPIAMRLLNPYMDPYYMINNGLTTETRLIYGVPQYNVGWL